MTLPPPPAIEPTGRWVRLSVLTPRGRADLALPADVPVAELVPMVRELVGGAGQGGVPQAWRFTGPAGGPLPADATLDELRVREGELLHLGPARPAPAPPRFDDAAEALAHAVGEARDRSRAGRGGGLGAAVLGTVAGCAALTTVAGPLRPVAAAAAAVAALAALAVTRRCGRSEPDTGAAAAWCAVPAAATAGALLAPGPPGAGAVLLAATGAVIAAALGQIPARAVSPVLVAIAVAGTGTALAALARLLLDAPAAAVAAGLAAPALAVGPLLPRLALRLAGTPAPPVPADAGELAAAERMPPGDTLTVRAGLARTLHSGALAGTAVTAAGGALVATVSGGPAGGVLLAVTAAVLLMRSRALAEPVPARVLAGTAVLAVAVAAVPVALAFGPVPRLAVGAALLLVTAVGAVAVRATPSPPARRALDIAELVLTAAAIPASLAAMGLFTLVRGL
ncbi:type VII secretion integral membrane protein EccD [Pseudonocardia sp. NPDC049635]|uniref:type VII secretion integral membrane protein EccD n=1 Tax=Pseudonocardia sp. NPDC049635 TaxID=3155506 RepID=UPI0033C86B1D